MCGDKRRAAVEESPGRGSIAGGIGAESAGRGKAWNQLPRAGLDTLS